jgi:indolepyruvate ferredoxin oxidoreductase
VTKTVVTLDDRYEQRSGQIFLSSMQALVRLPLDQRRRDAAAGLNTAGYISGYRGSPITTLDAQLWSAQKLLDAHDIHFEPGLNEELAATSLRGTQQLGWFGHARYDGVFAMWYGKGLGVDRACEALKLANFEGTHAKGGVLVVAGDDHAAKSSASAHQSEHTLIAGFIPILSPSTTTEILLYGQLGWAMSRFTGLYIGMKTVTDTLDLTSSVILPDISITLPDLSGATPLNLRRSLPALLQESLVVNERLPASLTFARANGLNRVIVAPQHPQLVIVTSGKSYLDVRQALHDLGLDDARCAALGLGLVKLGMTWPLDAEFIRATCGGARKLLVVEEKRPVIEEQLASALYSLPLRPEILGKRDEQGRTLFPADNVLDATMVRHAILHRLESLGLADDDIIRRSGAQDTFATALSPATAVRPAFFCSGCPHNSSTNIPDGSIALGATGCHGLAAFMPERRTMNVVGMGAEGLAWVGAQHFVETRHVFANMGDGTYTHSGLLAIRAALSAKANITFKILYNDAVAMTGGQPMEGNISVDMIIKELQAEGVQPVILVSDEPEKFSGQSVRVVHRDHLEEVQRELRERPGVTAIVYEQTCANEKRRRRKRGDYPDPDLRLFINPAVCEGCGDCSRQSNCVSITPLETEFGRKRAIDQSNCNKDYSCIKGYCPSFVSLRGAKPAKRAADISGLDRLIKQLPAPAIVDVSDSYSMLVTGIGGTGVLTVGAILGTAAHMEGISAKVLDMTGMAQKGGGVMSHVRFSRDAERIPSARLGIGQTDLLVACDLIVASGPDVVKTLRPDTRVAANEDVVPTGEFQTRPDLDLTAASFMRAIERRVGVGKVSLLRANELAAKLLGDTIFTNLMMVGFVAQQGLLPVALDSIEAAVKLNGTAVKQNLMALSLGRLAAACPDELLAFANLSGNTEPRTLAEMIASRTAHLTAYQNATYAARYNQFIDEMSARLNARLTHPDRFLLPLANQLARLMAYKDEYEIARLYSLPSFREELARQFEGDFKFTLNFGSPLLSRKRDAKTGRPKKVELGPWVFPLLKLLSRMKFLRGTIFDLPGYQAERRTERRLIGEYREMIRDLADRVTDETMADAAEIANAAHLIAGYGPVKEEGAKAYRERVATLLAGFGRGKNTDTMATAAE